MPLSTVGAEKLSALYQALHAEEKVTMLQYFFKSQLLSLLIKGSTDIYICI